VLLGGNVFLVVFELGNFLYRDICLASLEESIHLVEFSSDSLKKWKVSSIPET